MTTTTEHAMAEEAPSSGLPARGFSHLVYDMLDFSSPLRMFGKEVRVRGIRISSRLAGLLLMLVLGVAFYWQPLVLIGLIFLTVVLFAFPYQQAFVYQHVWVWVHSSWNRRRHDSILYATDFRTPEGLERRPFDAQIVYVGVQEDARGGQLLPVISPINGREDTFFVLLNVSPTQRDVEDERLRARSTVTPRERGVAWMDGDDRQEWNMAFMGFVQTILDVDGVMDVSWSSIKLPADPYDNMYHLGHRVELGENMVLLEDPHVAEQWNNILEAHALTHDHTLDTVQLLTVRMDRKKAWHGGVRPDVTTAESRASQPFLQLYASISNRAAQIGFRAVTPAPHELPMLIKAYLDPAGANTTYRRFKRDVEHLHAEVAAGGERRSVLETDTVVIGPWVNEIETAMNMVRLGDSWHTTFRVENFGHRKVNPGFFNGMVQFGDDVGWVSHTVHASPSNGKVISWFDLHRRNAKIIKSEERQLASPEIHLDAAEETRQLFETAASSGRWATYSMLVHISARTPSDLERIADAVMQMYEVQGILLSRVIPDLRQVPAVLQGIGINVET